MNVEGKSSKSLLTEAFAWGLVGLLARALYVFWVVGKYGKTQFSDFLYLHQLAESLSQGNGFTIEGVRIFDQSVGYPAFLSLFYKLFGADVWTAMAVNVVLGAISVGLVYFLTVRLFAEFGVGKARSAARVSALLAAFYPDSLLYCALVSSENLLIPLLLLLLVFVVDRSSGWLNGVVVGIAAAAACSVKAQVLLFCLTIPFIWFVRKEPFLIRTSLLAVTAALCLAPWTVLNFRATGGHVLPFAAVSGMVLLDGTNPGAHGKPTNQYHLTADVERGRNAVELDRLRMKQALEYIVRDPLWYAGLCLKKAAYACSPGRDFVFEFQGQARFFNSFLSRWYTTFFNAFLLLAIVGSMIALRRMPSVFVVAVCLFGSQLVLQVIFCAFPRYRFPLLFCLLPYCALWVTNLAFFNKGASCMKMPRAGGV